MIGWIWTGLTRRPCADALGVVAHVDSDGRPSVYGVTIDRDYDGLTKIVGEPRQLAACLDEVAQAAALRLLSVTS